MSAIDEVKQKVDIVDIIGQYTTLTKAGRTFRGLCPFHSEKHPSFFVYPEQQSWHCFGACGTGGDAFSFIMKKQGIDFGEALRFLAERVGVTIPSRLGVDSRKDEKERLYQANEAATQYFHNLLLNSPAAEKTRNYLAGRGVLPKTITDFQLGFSLNSWEALKQYLTERGFTEGELLEAGLLAATDSGKTHDRFRLRLLFPISDARGRTIGFGARVLDDSLPKYINSPQTPLFDKSSNLYGLHLAVQAIRQQDIAVVVEGYMDVIIAHQYGLNNVIAAMGTAITEKQVSTIKRLTRNMLLALDADDAGEEAMLRCVSYENTLGAEVKVIILPPGKDPDDVIREDAQSWQHLADNALPVIDYTLKIVTSKLDLTTARDKSAAVERLLPIVAQLADSIRQDHYLNQLSRLSGVTYSRLETALSRLKTTHQSKEPKPAPVIPVRHLLASPLEEYCLTLLLQHPELKNRSERLLPEYFESSANRTIFTAWQAAEDISSLRAQLDTAMWEYLDALLTKSIPGNQIEPKLDHCILDLRKESLRRLEAKRGAILALAAETGGTQAVLAKLEEQGIDVSIQLGEIFTQKARKGQ